MSSSSRSIWDFRRHSHLDVLPNNINAHKISDEIRVSLKLLHCLSLNSNEVVFDLKVSIGSH